MKSIFETASRKRIAWLACFALMGCLLAEALLDSGVLNPIDQRLQDYWFQWQGKRIEASHVVIVSIDEDTLADYPDDPLVFWTDRLAVAVAKLRQAQVRTVGLDMLLSISPGRWLDKLGTGMQMAARDYDRTFREQINSGKVVLVASRSVSGALASDYLLPSPDYLLALPDFDIPRHVGLANFFDEGDGVVRHFQVAPSGNVKKGGSAEGAPVLGFAALLAIRATGLDPMATNWKIQDAHLSRNPMPIFIPYVGPPGSIPLISLKQLLDQDPLSESTKSLLRDKVVLIGVGTGLNDDHFTPYSSSLFSRRGSLMSGVEVHANVVEALLSGQRLSPMNSATRVALLFSVCVGAALAFSAMAAWLGAFVWFGGVALMVVTGYLLFRAGLLIPITAFAVASALVLLGVIA